MSKLTEVGTWSVHPAAQLLHEQMPELEFEALVEAARVKKAFDHSVEFFEDAILEGINRALAWLKAGNKPEDLPRKDLTKEDIAGDPYAYAYNTNVIRRSMSPGARAKKYLEVVKQSGSLRERRKKPRPPNGGQDRRKTYKAAELAREAGVPQRTMERALAKSKGDKVTPEAKTFDPADYAERIVKRFGKMTPDEQATFENKLAELLLAPELEPPAPAGAKS